MTVSQYCVHGQELVWVDSGPTAAVGVRKQSRNVLTDNDMSIYQVLHVHRGYVSLSPPIPDLPIRPMTRGLSMASKAYGMPYIIASLTEVYHHPSKMASSTSQQHRALQLQSIDKAFQIVKVRTPQADPGSAIIRIEAASILSYHREIYNGTRHYSFPAPLVCGSSAIVRVVELGPDATLLEVGQLVYVDCVIRARDNTDTLFLSAIHDSGAEGSAKLMRDVWRDGTFAEYVKFALENCFPLDEQRLCRGRAANSP